MNLFNLQSKKVVILFVLVLSFLGFFYLQSKEKPSLIFFLRDNAIWSIDPVSKREEKLTGIIPQAKDQISFYDISSDKKFAYTVEQNNNKDLSLKRFNLGQGQIDDLGIVGQRSPRFNGRHVGWIPHLSPTGKRILIESWPGHLAERVETVQDLDNKVKKTLDVSELKFSPEQPLIFKEWLSNDEFIIQVYSPPKSIVYKVDINSKSAQKLFEIDSSEFNFNKKTKEIIATTLDGEIYHVKIFDLNGIQKADVYQAKKLSPISGFPVINAKFTPNSQSILLEIVNGAASLNSPAGIEYKILKRSTGELVDLPLRLAGPIRELSPDFTKALVSESDGLVGCQTRIYDINTGLSDVLIKNACDQLKWVQ